MSDNRFPIDDPRLTAYALGELDSAEAVEFERLLDASPGSRGAVDEIRDLAGLLAGELRQEQAPGLRAEQRAAILQAAAGEFPNGVLEPAATQATAKPSPSPQRVGGGPLNGKWGRRFASVMTVAAMIMVAVMLLPSQRPGVNGGAQDHFFSEFDGEAPSGGGGGGLGLAFQWHLPTGSVEPKFKEFSDRAESFSLNGQAEGLSDGLQSMGDLSDETRSAPLAADDSGTQPEKRPDSTLLSRSFRQPSDKSQKQLFDSSSAGDRQAAAVNGPVSESAPSHGNGTAVVDRRSGRGGPGDSTPVELKSKSSASSVSNSSVSKDQREAVESNSNGRRRLGASEARSKSKSPADEAPRVASKPEDSVELEGGRDNAGNLGGYGGFKPRASKLSVSSSPAGSTSPTDEKGGPESNKESGKHYSENAQTANRGWRREAAGMSGMKGRISDSESKLEPSSQASAVGKKKASVKEFRFGDGYHRASGRVSREEDETSGKQSLSKGEQKSDLAARTDSKKARPLATSEEALGESDAPVDFDATVVDKKSGDAKSIDKLVENQRSLETVRRKNAADSIPVAGDELSVVAGLTKKVTVNFERAPLQEVLKQVAEQGEFRYTLDANGLTQQGLSPQTPVTLNVNSVPAEVALEQVLTPLALDFAVSGESVRITNRAEFVEAERAPGTEEYDPIVENSFVAPLAAPLSTFSIDVDTASYANVRRFVTQQQLPPRNAVRVEELVNYFSYNYPQPEENRPVAVNVDVGRAPWRPEHRLVRIGLKAREIPRERRPASSLVFLVDVSGSMSSENKLPLVKRGLTLLTEQMTEGDRVAIVTYSDTATVRLDSTSGDNRKPILDTINSLHAAGSTNGAGGIQLAYRTAIDHFVDGGTNRVILCTDGDFNVGVSGDDELVQLIQDRARSKVFFSVFGFGMGNLKDGKLEKLADKGNGHYAYIDGQREAQKVFVDELASTLITVAKDVKLQVEFNPARVGAYRLIGYENRALATQDFHDDRKDAGEMGAGHTVTALYEIAPADRFPPPPAGEALRYQRVGLAQAGEVGKELMSVRVRYKLPEADESSLFEVPVIDPLPQATVDHNERKDDNAPSEPRPPRDFEWAAAVAAYGMVLRDSQYRGQAGLDMVLELAQGARGDDPTGRRQEFIDLVQQTKSIRPSLAATGALYLSVRVPATLTPQQAEQHATVNGKYRNLLRIVPADGDTTHYGSFHEFGRWEGTSYLGHDNLPRGYWVYVAPNWYIWGDGPNVDTIKK